MWFCIFCYYLLLLLWVVVIAAAVAAKKIVPRMTLKRREPVAAHRQKRKTTKTKLNKIQMPRMNIPIHTQYTCMYYVTSKKSVHKPGQTFNRKINIAAYTHTHTHPHTYATPLTGRASFWAAFLLSSSFVLGVPSSLVSCCCCGERGIACRNTQNECKERESVCV